jgi:hypothetical protein
VGEAEARPDHQAAAGEGQDEAVEVGVCLVAAVHQVEAAPAILLESCRACAPLARQTLRAVAVAYGALQRVAPRTYLLAASSLAYLH